MAEAVKMPRLSDTMTEGVIQAWHKKVGDTIKLGDIVADIETDKAVMEFESFQEGTLLYVAGEVGKPLKVDEIIAIIGKPGEDYAALLSTSTSVPAAVPAPIVAQPAAAMAPEIHGAVAETTGSTNGRLKASPLAKKIALDNGVNINDIQGTGDEGRIVKRDIEAALSTGVLSPKFAQSAPAGVESYDEVSLNMMRKTIARRLTESKFGAPEFYLTISINMDNCVAAREAITAGGGPKVSYNDFIIKAAASALKQHPHVNSAWMGDKIRYYHHVHMGVAVAVEDGLLVPVIRFADTKSMSAINAEVKEMAGRAKERKLQHQEMEGNTFTISNLGMFDIDEFTAIINPPSSCIMAIGKMAETPVVMDGQIDIAHILKVTLTCDHRVVDGATGAQFLHTFKQMLENPVLMLV